MPPRRDPRRLHPALAVLIALGLHGVLWAGLRRTALQARAPAAPAPELRARPGLALATEAARASRQLPDPAASFEPAPTPSRLRAARPREQPLARADPAAAPESTAPATLAEAAEAGVVGAAPAAAPIDLGLNGGVRRAALLGQWLEPVAEPQPPDDGGLREGLAALDAERGQSRSNSANHAAYEAASRYAPATGMGIFDILTDERGLVLSVTLAGAPADEARWQRVGQELQQLLEGRRLRVLPGAKGLAARLRIETGDLARDSADRSRSERRAALGQGSLQPRESRAESTRASLEPGQLSPSLGMSAGGGGSQRIRVTLLSERTL